MMRELNKVDHRSHFNQFQTCQEKIGVLGDFVGELNFNQLSGEELDQQSHYHRPDVNKQLVQSDFTQTKNQDSDSKED